MGLGSRLEVGKSLLPASFSICMQNECMSVILERNLTPKLMLGDHRTHDFDKLGTTAWAGQPVYMPGPGVFAFMTEDCLPFRVIGHEGLYSMSTWIVAR